MISPCYAATPEQRRLYNVRILSRSAAQRCFRWIGEVKRPSLTLGVVAAALTDLDDRLAGRLRNLAITLVCFLSPPPPWSCCFRGRRCLPLV